MHRRNGGLEIDKIRSFPYSNDIRRDGGLEISIILLIIDRRDGGSKNTPSFRGGI